MIGFSDHGTVIGYSDHGLSDHGKPDQLISTDPVSTEGVSTDQENTRRESGASADGADAPPSPTADFDLDAVPQEEPERTPKADLGSGTPNQRQSTRKTPAQKASDQRPTPAPEHHRTWRDGIHELVKDSDYLRGAEKQFDRHGNLPPGSGTNPVQIWYELFPITDPTARWNAVYERKLAQNFPDINKFRAIATTFSERGYERTKNFECLRDWYNDPSKMNRTYASSTNGSNPTGATTAGTNGGLQNASTTQTTDDDAEFNARYANPQIMPTVPIRDTPAAYA